MRRLAASFAKFLPFSSRTRGIDRIAD